jgi:enoyl-CoA hydratase/carnithine racemase
MTDVVLVERPAERVAHVILNRPQRRNALTAPLASQLAGTIRELNDDDTLNALVVRDAGGAFCAGLDLDEFAQDPPPDRVATFERPMVVVGARRGVRPRRLSRRTRRRGLETEAV